MGNSFLEEQLERVRKLTQWMAQAHSDVAENSKQISRARDAHHDGPLQDVRDYRIPQSRDSRDRANDPPARRARRTATLAAHPASRRGSRRKKR